MTFWINIYWVFFLYFQCWASCFCCILAFSWIISLIWSLWILFFGLLSTLHDLAVTHCSFTSTISFSQICAPSHKLSLQHFQLVPGLLPSWAVLRSLRATTWASQLTVWAWWLGMQWCLCLRCSWTTRATPVGAREVGEDEGGKQSRHRLLLDRHCYPGTFQLVTILAIPEGWASFILLYKANPKDLHHHWVHEKMNRPASNKHGKSDGFSIKYVLVLSI